MARLRTATKGLWKHFRRGTAQKMGQRFTKQRKRKGIERDIARHAFFIDVEHKNCAGDVIKLFKLSGRAIRIVFKHVNKLRQIP